VRLPRVLEWCERAARHERYALGDAPDRSFHRSLVTGVKTPAGEPLAATSNETLTRGQLLGVIANLRFPALRVLETADFHGAILQTRTIASGRTFGSSPYFASYLRSLSAENPEGTVLISAGDCFQGTMISNLTFGRTVVEQMNALEYTAMAIGNHEFDWSADTLARRIEEMHFSALGANIRERASGQRPYWAGADTVVRRRGLRVGILGLSYRDTPSVTLIKHIKHLEFLDDSVVAARAIPALRGRSDVVLSVGHTPAESGRNMEALSGDLVRLAKGVPGVDAWFGGHSHNRVADRINGVPVLIAGSRGYNVAVCDLVVDPLTDTVVESRFEVITTFHDTAEPDEEFLHHVERWNEAIAPIAAHPVGKNATTLTRTGPEATVGNLVTDAIRAAAHADIALQNSGGLRADLAAGTVTRGMVYQVMPFDNIIVTMELTGAQVRMALEQSLDRNRVTQVSGIRYRYDITRRRDDRLLELTDENGVPLDPEKTYVVACNDFMATGGNNYAVLMEGKNITNRDILVRDAIESFVIERSKNGGALDYHRDGRVERTGGGS